MKRHEPARATQGWQRGGILFGCDYNPEQWPESVWNDDVALMVQAGIDIVAINIFGWASIEPRPGEYDFDSLDAIIALLHENGIRVNLGTGTSSPPPWLSTQHPEILPVMADGTTRWPGGRQAWCPSSPVFREHALRLASVVAERYGDHPAVALWHVSNELGCHNALCYCDVSATSFRRWLEARYATIERLNDAWGTSFWSQRYSRWSEILPPRTTVSTVNPGHRLDFERFSSEELLSYYRDELAIVRAASSVPVTTNFMITAHIRTQDYWRWAPEVDLIANDHYVDYRLEHPEAEVSFSADLTRGLADGNPWLLMETSTSAVSWQPYNIAKVPGELARTVASHVARGADGICFFQWRASRQGAEKFHSALLPHAGTDSGIWRETLGVSAMLDQLAPVSGSRVDARAAIMFSWEAWWAVENDTHPSQDVKYMPEAHRAYAALRTAGVTVDFVPPGANLSGYSLVIVPTLYCITDVDAQALSDYVAGGGHVMVTFFSGLADDELRLRMDVTQATPPGAFAELLGAWTEEFFPLNADGTVVLSDGSTGTIWTEIVRVTTATVMTEFADGQLPGQPAATSNVFGEGRAIYVATALDDDSYAELMAGALTEAGVVGHALGRDVEVVSRSNDTDRFVFVINHSDREVSFTGTGTELTTGERVEGTVFVPAGAVRVLRESIH
ncbi:beta-galactosidase [Salinibacterium xinjiangense]|uniref:Beta-galactosidase n=1 Tax=Salinibacterium xinjiangense TaxID=386302 RepID=A0A2C8ZAQ9_9MICO|nr:beta-galactosidase [Salinibacterium xinjiangense]GGK90510.1 beta-galactosidase [Salinibacterium xinjiangense]SOE61091.1 beta-galactosidase [Salinibacterium xinjiangense]